MILPWIDILLQNIKEEYKKPPVKWEWEQITIDDMAYIKKVVSEPVGFDADRFIKESLKQNLRKAVAGPHSIICFSNESPPIDLWFRIIRCMVFSSTKSVNPVQVLFFGNEKIRMPPLLGHPVKPVHINGGYTNQCNLMTIVIYREEDSTRVLIHEILHGLCSDPELPIAQLEANTEAWAEILYIGFKAKGQLTQWKTMMKKQIQYAKEQANYVMQSHQSNGPDDYGWRYLQGRLEVWDMLGLDTSGLVANKVFKTLKLTYV
jgi:hypothetical protein